jgi:zinc protease
VGNINPDHVEKILDAELDNFPRKASRSSSPVPNIIVTPMTKPVIVKRFRDDLNAGYVMVGYLAPGAGDKDYPEMLVINALLGGMKSSLMFENVREKLGLGYEVASVYPNQLAISDIVGYDVTAPTKEDPETKKSASVLPQVQEALLAQFHELTVTPPTADDLARAKRYLIGSYLIAHEQLEDRAFYLGYSEIALRSIGGYRFDTNYADAINAITAADVQRVAQQYFGGNGYVVSMLMPQENDPDVIKE